MLLNKEGSVLVIIFKNINAVIILGIIIEVAIFYIYCGIIGGQKYIAQHSLQATYAFLLSHVMTIGVDQFILSRKYKNKTGGYKVGLYIFYPFYLLAALSITLFTLIDFLPYSFFSILGMGDIYQQSRKFAVGVILLIIFCAIYAKIFTSIIVKTNSASYANILFFGKFIGFGLGVLLAINFSLEKWTILIILMTELVPFVLLSTICWGKLILYKRHQYKKRYFFTAVNIFSFDSLMKIDLIMLSQFGDHKYLPVYAILSSVYEGFIQIFISYRYKFAEIVSTNMIMKEYIPIIKTGLIFTIFFTPAFLIFNLITTNMYDMYIIISMIILQIALILSVPGVIGFHFYELIGKPQRLTGISLFCVLISGLISFLLIEELSILAVALSTAVGYLLLSIINILSIKHFYKKY